MYFELHLDEFGVLSTAPSARPAAWEQAVFPVTCDLLPAACLDGARCCPSCSGGGSSSALWLCRGDVIAIHASCTESLVSLKVAGVHRFSQIVDSSEQKSLHNPLSSVSTNEASGEAMVVGGGLKSSDVACTNSQCCQDDVTYIDRPDLARLNDAAYWCVWEKVISSKFSSRTVDTSTAFSPSSCKILDLTHGLPMAGLLALNSGKLHLPASFALDEEVFCVTDWLSLLQLLTEKQK